MVEISTNPLTRAPTETVSPDDAALKALTEQTEKRIKLLDQRIEASRKNLKTDSGVLDSFFGTKDAQLANAANEQKLIKSMQEQKMALTKALEEAKNLKPQEARTLLETSLKQDQNSTKHSVKKFQLETQRVDMALDESIAKIETAEAVTQTVKDTAIISGAIVTTVMTAGAGGTAAAAITKGTLLGTSIGVAANTTEAGSHVYNGTKTTEQAILDACEQTQQHSKDSFKTSITSLIGAGVATKAATKATAAKLSATKIAATKAVTQGSSSAVISSAYDTYTQRQQADEDFSKQYANEIKNASKEEYTKLKDDFFKAKGLDAGTMAKNIAIDTVAGGLSAFVGSKIPGPADKAISKTSVNIARGVAIIGADVATGTAIGLGTAATKGEDLNLARELTSNITSALQGTASAHVNQHSQRIAATSRKLEIPAPVNEFAPTAAKPRIDISENKGSIGSYAATITKPNESRPCEINIRFETRSHVAHEIAHSAQQAIDPGIKNKGKVMPLDEYIARRALQESQARADLDEHHTLKKLIDNGQIQEATDMTAFILSPVDRKQYAADYEAAISRRPGDVIYQKSFSFAPRQRDNLKRLFTRGLEVDPDFSKGVGSHIEKLLGSIETVQNMAQAKGENNKTKASKVLWEAAAELNDLLGAHEQNRTGVEIKELRTEHASLNRLIEQITEAEDLTYTNKQQEAKLQAENQGIYKQFAALKTQLHQESNRLSDQITEREQQNKARIEAQRNAAKLKAQNDARTNLNTSIAAIRDPDLQQAARSITAQAPADLSQRIDNQQGNRSVGKWYEELLTNSVNQDYFNSLAAKGDYSKGAFSAKRTELILEKLMRAGAISDYKPCADGSFDDHFGIDIWARTNANTAIPLQIKSSGTGASEHRSEHTSNAEIIIAGNNDLTKLEGQISRSISHTQNKPAMINPSTPFDPFNPTHQAQLSVNTELQKNLLRHFLIPGTPKYNLLLGIIESGRPLNRSF